MTSISPIAALPPALATPLPTAAVIAAVPAAMAEAEAMLAAVVQPQSAPAANGASPDGAAMRPDQLFMARQLQYPAADAATLARGWRAMVTGYRSALIERHLRARVGMLAPAQLLAAQEGRPGDARAPAPDLWRFTIHAGGPEAQQLRVVQKKSDATPGRRRRPRAALRLDLTLANGELVAVQLEPMPGGVGIELAAPSLDALARLRLLQPELQQAVERAGLRVMRWSFQPSLAAGAAAHAELDALDAAGVLTLPVFHALAEMALLQWSA